MRHGVGHSGGSIDSVLVKVLLGLFCLGMAGFVLQDLFAPKVCPNYISAIATLRNLATVQQDFRESRHVDIDGDGVGEFGTFCELTGDYGVRTAPDASRRGARLDPPILSPALAGVNREGVVTKSGYAFRIFLPGAEGGAVHERGMAGVKRAPSSRC